MQKSRDANHGSQVVRSTLRTLHGHQTANLVGSAHTMISVDAPCSKWSALQNGTDRFMQKRSKKKSWDVLESAEWKAARKAIEAVQRRHLDETEYPLEFRIDRLGNAHFEATNPEPIDWEQLRANDQASANQIRKP